MSGGGLFSPLIYARSKKTDVLCKHWVLLANRKNMPDHDRGIYGVEGGAGQRLIR